MKFFNQLLEQFSKNTTKIYLVLANIILVIFAIWFSNVGFLPFKNLGDFAFFAILALILGLYRPGWTFVFFIGALVLENVNLMPKEIGLMLRPYQFFGLITIIALMIQFVSKRLAFPLPKFQRHDGVLLIFAAAGFLSSMGALQKGMSFKQSVVALSFVALYFLTRVYVQSLDDLKRIVPFFLSSGMIVTVYAIWQNVRFLVGSNSFEVMPGRPNGTFTEPDWFGIYLVFMLAMLFVLIYQNKKNKWLLSGYLFLTILTMISLILTVSRSAWIGAIFVVIVFLKFNLLEKCGTDNCETRNGWRNFLDIFKMQKWQWRQAGTQLLFVLFVVGVGLLLSMPLTHFQVANRAVSTGGLQKITISCPGNVAHAVPYVVKNLNDILPCKHINLEDIASEKAVGNIIMEVSRPDPNVNIRKEIYQKSWEQIKKHPVLGLGWGGISSILGSDERGAGLNASNIFLEVWFGSGIFGILSFSILIFYLLIKSISLFLNINNSNINIAVIAFVMFGWAAIVIPNLFNSGIFLGFIWVYLAIAIGLMTEKKKNIK